MQNTTQTSPRRVWEANRFGLDYRAEGARLGPAVTPIVDVHSHINGARAARIYRDAMDAYGVEQTWSQTQLAGAEVVGEVLGERVRFVAIPSYMDADKARIHREGFLENISVFAEKYGSRMVKLWHGPRIHDFFEGLGEEVLRYDGAWRVRAAELAVSLGMMIQTHVADPDTWFRCKYTDPKKYGTKLQQYEPFERMMDRFGVPWIAAHMGGWPEDLEFLDGLLSRHGNLHLDTSATKWMVRELSRHSTGDLIAFLRKWDGRILFGSDIVTIDEHLEQSPDAEQRFGAQQASTGEEAFELYASRYWALRTMWETGYRGESNIADPDLAMEEPEKYDAMSAPALTGHALPRDLLESLYGGAARKLAARWEAERVLR